MGLNNRQENMLRVKDDLKDYEDSLTQAEADIQSAIRWKEKIQRRVESTKRELKSLEEEVPPLSKF